MSRRLGRLAVAPARRDLIVRDLAGFLEDHYEERLRLGDSPRAARRAAISSAGRWPDIAGSLERVEGSVERRLRTLWLPGLGVSVAALGLLLAVSAAGGGIGVRIVWHPPQPPLLFYWPWLLTLPLLGAAGAAWSRREGAGRRQRLLVALFPALAFLALFPMSLAVIVFTDAAKGVKLSVLAFYLLNWVVLPAVALLLGALPVLHRSGPAARPA